MPKITGKIEEVKVIKSGKKNGRPWTLYRVKINGRSYSTFDSGYQKLEGQTRDLEYKTEFREVNGTEYENRILLTKTTQSASQVNREFEKIDNKLDMIIAMLRGMDAKKMNEEEDYGDEGEFPPEEPEEE